MNSTRIVADHVAKSYVRSAPQVTWRDVVAGRWRRQGKPHTALRDVSFSVAAGEMLGIIGANGAGKSTLLRLLGGVGRPTSGRIETHGRIGALLDLGGGFLGDLTGRENATLAGVAAGLHRAALDARLPAIVEFAEIEEYLDAPLHTYSSGMAMRLAFSVAVHTDPDILLVDEFLSVGDLAFQAKCLARIRRLQERGCAIVLVSHSMEQIRQMCSHALWLRRGEVAGFDAADVVAGAYETEMHAETVRRSRDVPARMLPHEIELRMRENRYGTLDVEITGVTMCPAGRCRTGDPLEVTISHRAAQPVSGAIFVVSIRRDDGTVCFDTNTQVTGADVPDLVGDGCIRLTIGRLDLGAGAYFLDVGIYDREWTHAYDYHWRAYPLIVSGPSALKGVLTPPTRWSIEAPGSKDARAASDVGRL